MGRRQEGWQEATGVTKIPYSVASRAGFSYELRVLANEPALPPLPSNRSRLPVSTFGLHVKAARKSTVERDMRVRTPEHLRDAETVCDAERETPVYRARGDTWPVRRSHGLDAFENPWMTVPYRPTYVSLGIRNFRPTLTA